MVRITARDNLLGRGVIAAPAALSGTGVAYVPPVALPPVTVLHLSDLQLTTSWTTDAANMKSALTSLNPDYLVVIGDVANNGAASEYAVYGANMSAWKAKTIVTPGNHDYTPGNVNAWFAYFGTGTLAHGASAAAPWFSYDLPNGWHVVGVVQAAGQSGSPSVAVGSTQYNWLAADLAANNTKPILVFWHQPRWSTDNLHGDSTTPSPFWDLCVANRVQMVLNGHVHLAQRFPRANSNSALNSLAPMEFTGDADYHDRTVGGSALTPSFASNTQAFLELTLDADHFDWRFVRISDLAVLDSGTSALIPPPG